MCFRNNIEHSTNLDSRNIQSNIAFVLQVLVATMAATATVSHGRHVDLSYMSEGYGYGYNAVPTYSYYNDYLHQDNYYHSLHKRSPVTPFKLTNPFVKIPTKGKLTPITLPTNGLICAFTKCKNKKFGLVI